MVWRTSWLEQIISIWIMFTYSTQNNIQMQLNNVIKNGYMVYIYMLLKHLSQTDFSGIKHDIINWYHKPLIHLFWLYSHIIIIIFNLRTAAFKAYCAIWVRRSNFSHQASPSVSPRDSTQRRKVELWARNVREFCLNADIHITFRNLLHATKLLRGTNGFTSPLNEGVLRIFSP